MDRMMILPYKSNVMLLSQAKCRATKDISVGISTDSPTFSKKIIPGDNYDLDLQRNGRIKEMFDKVELSVSSYDTAWVAMVPVPGSPNKPSFPQCLDWIMKNQHPDGSWGLHANHPLLVKDSLSSTLACVLALQKWSVGEQLIGKGLDFIGSNGFAAHDKLQCPLIGFDIIFPGMLCQAQEMGLHMPFDSAIMDVMLRNREREIQSLRGMGSHHSYFAEGLGDSYCCKEIMAHQRNNGSLFNSPATTAGALIRSHDDKCFQYLNSVLEIHGDAVPTIFPYDISILIHLVDTLEKMGIDRYFRNEIKNVLNKSYRYWQERNDDIFFDIDCCATAFRLLRLHGYEVSSDELAAFIDQETFFNTVSPQYKSTKTILQLFKAAQTTIFEREPILEELQVWTRSFLKHQVLSQAIRDEKLHSEVKYAIENANVSLDRLDHRKSIESCHLDDFQMLKTSYRCSNINKTDILMFALEDFNKIQGIHYEELQELERWVRCYKLDHVKFEWHMLTSCYFVISGLLIAPELSDARIVWTKAFVMAAVVDDIFEIDGSREEMLNMVELIKTWDEHTKIGYCSERIEIAFCALYQMINEFAAKALIKQGRCVRHRLAETLLNFLKSQMKEIEWWTANSTPTLDEYLLNAIETSGVGFHCMILYFIGPTLSEETLESEEYRSLYKAASQIARMFNDCQTDERERKEKKINCSSLLMSESGGAIDNEEEATKSVMKIIETTRRQLLRMTLQGKGSIVPQAIKEAIWKYSKMCHYAYTGGDIFRDPDTQKLTDMQILYEPLNIPKH